MRHQQQLSPAQRRILLKRLEESLRFVKAEVESLHGRRDVECDRKSVSVVVVKRICPGGNDARNC